MCATNRSAEGTGSGPAITRLPGRAGISVLEAIRAGAQPLRAPCAGRGTCGKCRVRIHASAESVALEPHTPLELEQLSASELAAGIRLACLARFAANGEVAVEVHDECLAIAVEEFDVRFDPAVRQAAIAAGQPLRVAIDIGTTTLAVCLVDAQSEAVLSVRTEANAQKSWGSDVVARIQAVCDKAGALTAMQKTIVRQLDRLIDEQLRASGRAAGELGLVAVAGNTVMLHLLVGADPTGMARLPFRPAFLESRRLPASACGFKLDCELVLLPGISPFVGADITAGILSTGLHRAQVMELLLDIGTNGEIVLGNAQAMFATATAAGPAFEGAQISHGCPGVAGALDHAGEGAEGFWYTTINDAPLLGICGSGLLDLAAWLRRSGALDETGYLDLPGGDEVFRPDPQSAIMLNQRDIRQLQLAKGAIAAGVELLCRRAGIGIEDIGRVHLAGGFGTFMRPASALDIGLLPASLAGKVRAAGNTALKGALLAVSAAQAVDECAAIASRTESVDLAGDPGFQTAFAECMLFPEALPDSGGPLAIPLQSREKGVAHVAG
jgi:uncharacterized 2Fe-2S/4Fe-4S cluster protein (DUF4445 family)